MGESQTFVDLGEFRRLARRVSDHDANCVQARDWMRGTERERTNLSFHVRQLTVGLFALGVVVSFLLGMLFVLLVLVMS